MVLYGVYYSSCRQALVLQSRDLENIHRDLPRGLLAQTRGLYRVYF